MGKLGFTPKTFHNRFNKALLEVKQKEAAKREEKISKEAYYLWESDGKPEGKSEYYWRKASTKVPPNLLLKPFYKVEKQLEDILDWLKRLAILEILGLVGNVTLILGLLAFFAGEQQRRNLEVYQAWQVITAAHEQGGSGGRIEALEFLNSSPGAPGIRRVPWFWLVWEPQSLAGLEAPKAYLQKIQLPKAVLRQANLQKASLSGANLQEAALSGANLQEAALSGANLQKAFLAFANLQKAFLTSANLQEAYLFSANLQQAFLNESNLQEAVLQGANLQQANLQRANLQEVVLTFANLQEADLEGASLRKADLFKANLQKANLSGANLSGANLSRANLQGAIYTNANSIQQNCELFLLNYPCPTRFPKGFNPQKAGMILFETALIRNTH